MLELLDNSFSTIDRLTVGCYPHAMKILRRAVLILTLSALLVGCKGGSSHDQGSDHSDQPTPAASGEEHRDHGHHHTAPHGGALVVFGEEFAHLEFVLAADSGTLTAYVLDGEAEKAVRLPGGTLDIMVKDGDKLVLEPVPDELTGETVEDTSTFRGQSDSLKGVENFEATLASITIKGQDFDNVEFHYPEGNEDHKHEEEHHEHDSW